MGSRNPNTFFPVPYLIEDSCTRVNTWSFNVFSLQGSMGGRPLRTVAYDILNYYSVVSILQVNPKMMMNFLTEIEMSYAKNPPLHDNIHAADVAATTFFILHNFKFEKWLNPLEIFCLIVASFVHELKDLNANSKGRSNPIDLTFELIKRDNCNFTRNWSQERIKIFKDLVADLVVATDSDVHQLQLSNLELFFRRNENNANFPDKRTVMKWILHCADVSYLAKDWSICSEWSQRKAKGYFLRAQNETNNIQKIQLDFTTTIVIPSFRMLSQLVDRFYLFWLSTKIPPPKPWEPNLITNLVNWTSANAKRDDAEKFKKFF